MAPTLERPVRAGRSPILLRPGREELGPPPAHRAGRGGGPGGTAPESRLDYEVGHGYTLADLHVVCRVAAGANRFLACDVRDRYDDAWHALVEHLLTVQDRPSRHDLAILARAAIFASVRQYRQRHGVRGRDPWCGVGSAPRFARYWYEPTCPWEDRVVERLAATQVYQALTHRDRRVIAALAACGDNASAASALNMPAGSFRAYISAARRRWLSLWHQGETPPAPRVVRPRTPETNR